MFSNTHVDEVVRANINDPFLTFVCEVDFRKSCSISLRALKLPEDSRNHMVSGDKSSDRPQRCLAAPHGFGGHFHSQLKHVLDLFVAPLRAQHIVSDCSS